MRRVHTALWFQFHKVRLKAKITEHAAKKVEGFNSIRYD